MLIVAENILPIEFAANFNNRSHIAKFPITVICIDVTPW